METPPWPGGLLREGYQAGFIRKCWQKAQHFFFPNLFIWRHTNVCLFAWMEYLSEMSERYKRAICLHHMIKMLLRDDLPNPKPNETFITSITLLTLECGWTRKKRRMKQFLSIKASNYDTYLPITKLISIFLTKVWMTRWHLSVVTDVWNTQETYLTNISDKLQSNLLRKGMKFP